MYIFGITGSFGTGKSTVSKLFSRLGAQCIDADRIVHKLIANNKKVYRKIVSLFGETIVNKKSRKISRKKLASIVFNNKRLLKKLCQIVHPAVTREIKGQIVKAKRANKRVVVIDAPLLIEANLTSIVSRLIVVRAKREVQIKRIRKKLDLSKSEILKRVNSQIPLKKKIKLADYVIDNSLGLSYTRRQVRKIWNKEIVKS